MLKVEIDTTELKTLGEKKFRAAARSATVRAANRAAKAVDKEAKRNFKKIAPGMKAKDLKKFVTTKKANRKKAEAIVNLIGRGIEAVKFKPRQKIVKVQTKRFGNKRRGVTIAYPNGGRQLVTGGFFVKDSGGNKRVVRRTHRTKSGLVRVFYRKALDIMKAAGVIKDLTRIGSLAFKKNFEREFQFYINRAKAKLNDTGSGE